MVMKATKYLQESSENPSLVYFFLSLAAVSLAFGQLCFVLSAVVQDTRLAILFSVSGFSKLITFFLVAITLSLNLFV
jgi:hypothetical protein